MNAACPVIITDDCGCHPDLVTDGVEGFVYPVALSIEKSVTRAE